MEPALRRPRARRPHPENPAIKAIGRWHAVPIGVVRVAVALPAALEDRTPIITRVEEGASRDEAAAKRAWLAAWLLHVPAEVSRTNWIARIATLVVFLLWTLWIWRDLDVRAGNGGSNFLHLVLLPFHEAGHYAIFRWFGPFIMTLGGTLGQHLMPIVLGGALLVKRRDPFGAAIFFWLLGFSTIDMAVYMYDAFDPQMTLLGGGTGAESDGHDWQNIFGDLGLLRRARGIGLFFGWVGRAMMLAAILWAAWVLRLQHARVSDSAFAESDIR
jgi:hypothetical protein